MLARDLEIALPLHRDFFLTNYSHSCLIDGFAIGLAARETVLGSTLLSLSVVAKTLESFPSRAGDV